MLDHSPGKMLMRRWKLLLFVGIFFAVVSAAASVLLPQEYRADAQVLIISKSRYGIDPYTVVKSAERVGENVAQVMQTSDFYNKVRADHSTVINWNRFEKLNERKKRKTWAKAMQPSVVFGTGVLNISTYSEDPGEAKALARAVAQTLETKAFEYVGGDVEIKLVNEPVATRFPARPNMPLNAAAGFVIGVLLSGVMVVRKRS